MEIVEYNITKICFKGKTLNVTIQFCFKDEKGECQWVEKTFKGGYFWNEDEIALCGAFEEYVDEAISIFLKEKDCEIDDPIKAYDFMLKNFKEELIDILKQDIDAHLFCEIFENEWDENYHLDYKIFQELYQHKKSHTSEKGVAAK